MAKTVIKRFRGKPIQSHNAKLVFVDKSEFVYGSLIEDKGRMFILSAREMSSVEIDPKTLGENTGFTSVSNEVIYTGDIVKARAKKQFKGDSTVSDVIRDECGQYCVRCHRGNENRDATFGLPLNWGGWVTLRIVGNIYDSPSLVDGKVIYE